jgi:hypothetical protein
MFRWTPALAALALLAACSQNEQGRAIITDRCVAGGESAEICKCFADQSSRKLDGDMFGIVVLGAQGDDAETDLQMKELTPERQVKFSATMQEIIRGCGAEGYLAAN